MFIPPPLYRTFPLDAVGVSGPLTAAGGIGVDGAMPLPPRRETREKELRELRDAAMQYGDANEVLNSRAVEVSGIRGGGCYTVGRGRAGAGNTHVRPHFHGARTQVMKHERQTDGPRVSTHFRTHISTHTCR